MSAIGAHGIVERLRRAAKWLIFHVGAGGDVRRYMALRARAMTLLGTLRLYERAHLCHLARIVRPGDTVVDAGAGFGIYAAALSARVGPSGRVHAFEPQALVFDALERVSLPHANVSFHRIALSNAAGSRTLRTPFVAGRVPEPALATLDAVAPPFLTDNIVTNTLDGYREELAGLAFVKADIEGHEIEFLEGARGVLLHWRPIVQIEDNTHGVGLAAWLRQGNLPGYTLCVLAGGELRRFDPAARCGAVNFYLVPEPGGGAAPP